jgi:hypothetical protein
MPPMNTSADRPRKGITKDREAEFEAVGAAVLVEHVLDDMKTRVETLRERLRNSLRKR